MTRRALIAGGGTMGAGIAAIFCGGGWETQVVEPTATQAKDLPRKITDCLSQIEQTGTEPMVVPALASASWDGVTVVVECLPEDLALKRAFFAELETRASAETILASNSSSFPISVISEGLTTQSRMAGLHFFMPAHLVPLVEVISGDATNPAAAEALCEMMESLGKRPVHVRKDIPGFLANRIQHAMMREALSLAEQGIASPEDIDAAVRLSFGMRFVGAGPILQKDLAGLDIHCAAATTIYPDLCNEAVPSKMLMDRVAAGDLGVKTGRGFYEWTDEKVADQRNRYDAALMKALKIVSE